MIWCHLYRWHPFSSSRRLGKPCQQARATRSPAFHHFPMARRANFAPSRVYHRLSSYSSFPFSLEDCSIRSVGDYLLKRGGPKHFQFWDLSSSLFLLFPPRTFPSTPFSHDGKVSDISYLRLGHVASQIHDEGPSASALYDDKKKKRKITNESVKESERETRPAFRSQEFHYWAGSLRHSSPSPPLSVNVRGQGALYLIYQ